MSKDEDEKSEKRNSSKELLQLESLDASSPFLIARGEKRKRDDLDMVKIRPLLVTPPILVTEKVESSILLKAKSFLSSFGSEPCGVVGKLDLVQDDVPKLSDENEDSDDKGQVIEMEIMLMEENEQFNSLKNILSPPVDSDDDDNSKTSSSSEESDIIEENKLINLIPSVENQ